MIVWPGRPHPLGAHYDGSGVNLAVFSEVADSVDVCLYPDDGEEICVPLPEVTGHVWHGYLPDAQPGWRYGFRVHGPYAPSQGLRCNPSKLLIDPYAKAIEGDVTWDDAVFGFDTRHPHSAASPADSAPFVPKGVIVAPYFDWGMDRPLHHPWHETVIYETHVKGLTARHPAVPEALRGTFLGVSHPAIIEHLGTLGVTAIELLPVHQFLHDQFLVERGLTNYWGYNSYGYFAPHNAYAARGQRGQQVHEFKTMVRLLHEAGIEVILDVVYNHTGEGGRGGPTLCFRGLDNAAYYRLDPEDPSRYTDYTGTGNSLNAMHPQVLQLIMDSLRYWVEEMHVDGFRFDLAATLARELHDVDRLSAFFDLIHQDPVVSRVKLIAEPWDVGEGGYQVGNFPVLWTEWNGKYRDAVRDYWRGESSTIDDLAYRLTGSSDLYEWSGRRPFASINFVTAHDGFTLLDLVSYDTKHNEANGDHNRDGTDDNRSWNCGVEGPTDDAAVNELRDRQRRNFLTTLLLSQGVPMLLGGDELGRTQLGNNNGYCQDNELSWHDWEVVDDDLLAFTRWLIGFRRQHPVFRRRRFFHGMTLHGGGITDIGWFQPSGEMMDGGAWEVAYAKSIGVFLNGDEIPEPGPRGERIDDDSFYLALNSWDQEIGFVLPCPPWGDWWQEVLDTARPRPVPPQEPVRACTEILAAPRSVLVFKRVAGPAA
ncbi:MAG: glycogen debranching protein GlgX [Acidimicrobiales bacterium]|nr:glycogen debranching protein GlgX [Acidimicrobiales bacterium]